MKILAIDPGTTHSALCWLYDSSIYRHEFRDNNDVLTLVEQFDGDLVAIEGVASYGMPVGAETFETCIWIGRFLQTAINEGLATQILFRKDIKLHLCGSMRAKDANIRQALLDRYGAQGTKKEPGPTYGLKSHAWAALAVATLANDKFKEDSK